MPTGYTAPIEEGISFKDFVLRCAKAFGACVTLRDDPMDAPIPDEFRISDYHEKALAAANSKAQELDGMTLEQAEKMAAAEHAAEMKRRQEYKEKNAALMVKYQDMLTQVEAWDPPTADHYELKNFMEKQIRESMRFDGPHSYYDEPVKRLTGVEWLEQTRERLFKDIEYQSAEHAKEVERVRVRNAWVKALRDNLRNLPEAAGHMKEPR